ncbi:diguanylate cyclase [Candidimonas sp. SYP-B2681]|uniref:diguanylate cyclase domain-containing protein n=1 Tax=Candidimonas sp. SYP-B2681 TaxID=2497686 RepID=UPI000F86FAF9|nr:diguanylate cyclase [Candidimonas sp. SYP-B2681]RTZ48083.1 diguanylate cyclase [Candidimonas sp. SYP-B2681]
MDLDALHRLNAGWPAARDNYKIMVLLVDDQPLVGQAIRLALASQPHINFHYCSRAEEALAVAELTKPTVILQDLVMPGVDGLALVHQYRTNPATADIPIVVLSSTEDPAIKRAAFAAGVNDYMVKVPDTIELVARIEYHSRFYISLQQRDAAFQALQESQQKLQEINLELLRLTNTDGLTGIANRRYFDDYLEAEWRRAKRERAEISMLLIDVDNFKGYNDTYGHVAGDELLRRIAAAIQAVCKRPADLAARFGGEEFALILPRTTAGGVALLGEIVRHSVAELAISHAAASTSDRVTVSGGGATLIPIEGEVPARLIELADSRLYRAKNQGKNRMVMVD